MGQDDTDLLASVEDVRKMTDPQDSLQALVAGIAGLQEQIQEVNEHSKSAQAQQTEEEAELEGADEAYRVSAVDPREKRMSSMLLARPPATSVQEDMERLVARLRYEIGTIETTLTSKMDRVEHQIKNLPDAKPKSDDPLDALVAEEQKGSGAANDGADSDDMELYSSSVSDIGAGDEEGGQSSNLTLSSSSFKEKHMKNRMKAAAAMEKVAAKVTPDALERTIWVGGIPFDHAETDEIFEANVRTWFDCQEFGKVEDIKLRRKDRSAGEYKSYCLVTYMFKGGKNAALAAGVSVTRTKQSLDDDRVDLKLKDVDKAKKKASPLSAVKEKARLQVLQKACDTYEKYLNPDGAEPHETAIEGLKALAKMQKSAGMTTEAQRNLSKAQSLESIAAKQKLRAAEKEREAEAQGSSPTRRSPSPVMIAKKWCDDD